VSCQVIGDENDERNGKAEGKEIADHIEKISGR
jgi:hypothetical protein